MLKKDDMPVRIAQQSSQKERFTNLVVIVGLIALVALGAKHLVENRLELLLQAAASLIVLLVFFAFGKRLRQDLASYLALTVMLVVHNLGLYSTHPLGIRFDHYTHFLGGFAVAIITDRIFNEKLARVKRFTILLMASLGVGALLEIAQWLDAYIIPGVEMFHADDISNTIKDLICDGLGGTAMGIITLVRKQ
jgi:uncharacterized membrane protein YjdF